MVLTKNTAEYTQKETKEPNWNTTHPPLLPPLKKRQLDTVLEAMAGQRKVMRHKVQNI